MRIVDPNNLGNTLPAATTRTGEALPAGRAGTTPGAPAPVDSDSVHLSSLSDRISQSLDSGAATRAAHVGQVAAAVEAGTYEVDSKAVSRALVEHALLSGNTGH